jgi:mannose-6-phosphate isomerase-like protein (cupin superfamily)
MSGYTVVKREDAYDAMEQYPGYGEMRYYTQPLAAEQVAITWRTMPPGTGGKGSYGHRHKTQEEIYMVLRGTVQAKLGDDVLELGPGNAVRVAPEVVRSFHNDGPEEVELVICSVRLPDHSPPDAETVDDFWPD